MSRWASWAVVVIGCAACGMPRERPPVCADDSGCGNLHPPVIGVGGTGGGDGGGTDAGSDVLAGSTTVLARVLIAQSIPLGTDPSATVPASGWTAASVRDPAAAPAMTDVDGNFTLTSVPVVDRTWLVRVSPPAGMALFPTLALRLPSTARHTILSVSQASLVSAGAVAGVGVDASLAHVVVQLVDTPATVAGVRVSLGMATTVPPAYDTGRGALTSGTSETNVQGTAVFFNVAVARGGVTGRVQLSRVPVAGADAGTPVEYAIPIETGHVTWVTAPPP